MIDNNRLSFIITNPLELNASLIPFLKNGGLFIPTNRNYSLGDHVVIELRLPDKNDPLVISGKVIWINPKNALHHAMPGIGLEFTGTDANTTKLMLEKLIDQTADVGNHVYGIERGVASDIMGNDTSRSLNQEDEK